MQRNAEVPYRMPRLALLNLIFIYFILNMTRSPYMAIIVPIFGLKVKDVIRRVAMETMGGGTAPPNNDNFF